MFKLYFIYCLQTVIFNHHSGTFGIIEKQKTLQSSRKSFHGAKIVENH